jgi:methylmalonyl-CoA mutase
MPDAPGGTGELQLEKEFPPVSTAAWEATIASDLKGADYDKKLVWKTDEGIAVRPYYRSENLPGELARPLRASGWDICDGPPPSDAINGIAFHEAGATAVQELGYALAEASDRLANGGAVTSFAFAIGSNYFFEIAKLRAARLLWARVAEAYSQPTGIRIHAVTALSNKSIYDPYTNLLRVTTESLSAVLGGADALTVNAAGFPERLAHNVQLVLKEEAHLDKVADAAGGAYYIEVLTDSLARQAWKVFQSVEATVGFAQSKDAIDAAIAVSRAAKEKAIASRRRTLVGVNNYPDINEKELDHAAAFAGATWRLAQPIENIRLRTERYAKQTGQTPKVLLLKRGDLKMKMARGQFCQNFFGCAGFAIEESESYEGTSAALIVLCSSDPEYVAFAQEVCAKVKVPVVVAGNPKEQIEEIKAAGVQGFVHVLSNMVETLTEWQDKLGIDGKEQN